jgi:para-nitrobenzyl esterase
MNFARQFVQLCPSAIECIWKKTPRRPSDSGLTCPALRTVLSLTFLASGFSAIGNRVSCAQVSERTSVVRTSTGDVQGLVTGGTRKFLGIPYAAPPVGDLRWRPPRDPNPWSKTLQATRFANTCPQPHRGVFAAPSDTEDCLYVNVFTPDPAPDQATRRPVMVWLHGGGLFSGESNDYDGSKLARLGDVVVVTLNYRIGALGFLSHPAINAEGHAFANYGIMDQQFALKWVQSNIAAFGGNPGNVTIFGQSGGGTSVMANLASPKAKGLFHRAINQSGTRIAVTTPATALKLGQEFATAAGCVDQSATCLRSLAVDQVLKNQAGILTRVVEYPSVDGTVIARTALDAFSNGDFNRVPILTGLVLDEQAFFLPELNTRKPLAAEDFSRFASSFGQQHVEKLLKKYPVADYASPSLAAIAMAQAWKACTARLLNREWVKYVPLYAYEFRDRTAPSYFSPVSYPMGAYHTAELQYLFPLFHGGQGTSHPLNAEQERLSDEMVSYWTAFARNGAPGRAGLPSWPVYSAERDNVQVLDLSGSKTIDGYGKEYDCAMWDGILSYR